MIASRNGLEELQFDLFEDSGITVLRNDLKLALLGHQISRSQALLETLEGHFPDDPCLSDYALVIAGQRRAVGHTMKPQAEISWLCEQVEPAAERVLGREAQACMAPIWRRLSAILEGARFNPLQPHYHASFTAARAGDCSAVRTVVEAEHGWVHDEILLRRHEKALEELAEAEHALDSLTRLCWDFPAAALQVLEGSYLFADHWLEFSDLDMPLEVTDFPAWIALHRGYAGPVPSGTMNTDAPAVLRLVNALVTIGRRRPNDEELALRRQLKARHPQLLAAHLNRNVNKSIV